MIRIQKKKKASRTTISLTNFRNSEDRKPLCLNISLALVQSFSPQLPPRLYAKYEDNHMHHQLFLQLQLSYAITYKTHKQNIRTFA